jgi:hypothetical protein
MQEQKKESNTHQEDSVEIADLEALAKSDKTPPKAEKYRIRIDKDVFVVEESGMTGRQLLILAGKNPNNFDIFKFVKGNAKPQKIGLDVFVDFTQPGLERFVTLPKEQKDGSMRSDFSLLSEDAEFLTDKSLRWEALIENRLQWLILYDYPVPEGYNLKSTELALQIPPAYPAAQIDMVYFFPPLVRNSGKAIRALSHQKINGKTFQRWSRHRNPGEWRPGLDNVATHLLLVDNWLQNELKR